MMDIFYRRIDNAVGDDAVPANYISPRPISRNVMPRDDRPEAKNVMSWHSWQNQRRMRVKLETVLDAETATVKMPIISATYGERRHCGLEVGLEAYVGCCVVR